MFDPRPTRLGTAALGHKQLGGLRGPTAYSAPQWPNRLRPSAVAQSTGAPSRESRPSTPWAGAPPAACTEKATMTRQEATRMQSWVGSKCRTSPSRGYGEVSRSSRD